ncbi:MAG: UDP-N-acetylmuramoyl-L-alanyl-D-glutamate--2,6-diaminopimelate ligase [Xanthomonadales bacterium]|nr:UDP-N-acetylmuramoyl-L-alanyl-D-glutamate--2,6-diaminopimelate ligase [Xanthomonadales bacterium]
MSLGQLLDGFGEPPEPELVVAGIGVDSSRIGQGDLFIALSGSRHHGLEFASEAVARGCAAVVWEDCPGAPGESANALPVPQCGVPFLAENLGEIASRFYRHPSRDMQVVGVTGTNGKTSYVEFFGRAQADAGRRCGTVGTLGSGVVDRPDTWQEATHTTPDAASLQRNLARLRDEGAELIAMEVSSHALDQHRVGGVEFELAAFTNLSRDHLDYHGSMASYAGAKARLFAADTLRFAILNGDDDGCPMMEKAVAANTRIIRYGLRGGDVRADDIEYSLDGLVFRLGFGGDQGRVVSPLIGQFNVYNLLAVGATLLALGWPLSRVVNHLSRLTPPPGRMNAMGGTGQALVVVDYAHTPDALGNALQAVRRHADGRVICVFGCGGDRDAGKRSQMGGIAERLADSVIVTDDNPRSEDGNVIISDILSGLIRPDQAQVIRDRALAIATAIQLAGARDVVLIAGKGHEAYQEVNGERRPFSDTDQVRQVLEDNT